MLKIGIIPQEKSKKIVLNFTVDVTDYKNLGEINNDLKALNDFIYSVNNQFGLKINLHDMKLLNTNNLVYFVEIFTDSVDDYLQKFEQMKQDKSPVIFAVFN